MFRLTLPSLLARADCRNFVIDNPQTGETLMTLTTNAPSELTVDIINASGANLKNLLQQPEIRDMFNRLAPVYLSANANNTQTYSAGVRGTICMNVVHQDTHKGFDGCRYKFPVDGFYRVALGLRVSLPAAANGMTLLVKRTPCNDTTAGTGIWSKGFPFAANTGPETTLTAETSFLAQANQEVHFCLTSQFDVIELASTSAGSANQKQLTLSKLPGS